MRTIALDACPGCGGSAWGAEPIGAHVLRRCDGCGVVFAPEYADPDAVYVDGYLTGATEFGPPNVLDPDFQRYLVDVGHRRVRAIERVTGGPGRFLDVGCGTGDVVLAASERGWAATGVEPVAESAAAAAERGLAVRCALLQESGLPERSFDAVAAYHVVEHMADSAAFLSLIARWAKPGGVVAVEVPNWGSVQRRRTRDRWVGLRPLEHLGHYDARTLRATMARAGLQVVSVRSSTYLWSEQTLGEALHDLGLTAHAARFRRLARPSTRHGRSVLVPTAAGWRVLRAIAAAYDRAAAGQVITAIGRVVGGRPR